MSDDQLQKSCGYHSVEAIDNIAHMPSPTCPLFIENMGEDSSKPMKNVLQTSKQVILAISKSSLVKVSGILKMHFPFKLIIYFKYLRSLLQRFLDLYLTQYFMGFLDRKTLEEPSFDQTRHNSLYLNALPDNRQENKIYNFRSALGS